MPSGSGRKKGNGGRRDGLRTATERRGLVEGRNPVMEALRAGRHLDRILVARGRRHGSLREIVALARGQGIPVQEIDPGRLDAISLTGTHQGIIALGAARGYARLEDILALARQRREDPLLLLLNGVEDPGNLGSLIRSAEGAGAHGVVIPQRRAAGLTAAVGRSSAGAVEYVPVTRVTNMARAVETLKRQGLWVAGADREGPLPYYEADLGGPLAVLVGGEGKGLSCFLRERCDFLVRIPLYGRMSSLNAAVAGAVILFEARRQREAGRRAAGTAGDGATSIKGSTRT